MRAGNLRRRVTIQESIPVQDDFGEPIDAWVDLISNPAVWASILSRASGERFISGGEQLQAEISHTVRMRYRNDLSVQMRLLESGRYLLIENIIDPNGKKSDLVLMCREIQD